MFRGTTDKRNQFWSVPEAEFCECNITTISFGKVWSLLVPNAAERSKKQNTEKGTKTKRGTVTDPGSEEGIYPSNQKWNQTRKLKAAKTQSLLSTSVFRLHSGR